MRTIFIGLTCLIFSCFSAGAKNPQTFLLDPVILMKNKANIESDQALFSAKKDLIKAAENILSTKKTYSVSFKKQIPPNGTKNDYYSLARYYWPDKSKRNGQPYVYIDGKVNPEIDDIPDHGMVANLSSDIYILGLAYFFSDDERYVEWINDLVRVFFIDTKTRMNPNLKYAQWIKGRNKNSNVTIGAVSFVKLIDGIQLVSNSRSINKDYLSSLKGWFGEFSDWILSQKALDNERYANNNTGIYYTVQITTYSLFAGRENFAKSFFEQQSKRIIDEQIDEGGILKNELKRAKPWDYVSYTVTALDYLVELSERLSIPLSQYRNSNGQGVDKVFEWLKPYAKGGKKWDYSKENVSSRHIAKVLMRSPSYTKTNERLQSYSKANYIEMLTTELIN